MLRCVVCYSHVWDLFCVVANSSVLSCPVAVGKTDLCVLSSGLLSPALVFVVRLVCPVVKDLVCLSELPLIPMLHQYELSVVAEAFSHLPPVFHGSVHLSSC